MRKLFIFFTILLIFNQPAFAIEEELSIENSAADNTQEQTYSGAVTTTTEFLDGDILKLSINAREMVNPVLGIAFHLLYDTNLIFLKYDTGDFLERGGDPFYLVKNDDYSKKIIFGETLRREDSFPLGDGIIAEFYFQILEEGDFNFSFENGTISSMDSIRQDIDLINWTTTQTAESGYGETSVSDATTGGDGMNIKVYALAAVAFLGLVMLFFFIRKSSIQSVNFKKNS